MVLTPVLKFKTLILFERKRQSFQGLVVEQNCLDNPFKYACNYLKDIRFFEFLQLSSIDKEKIKLGLKSKFLVIEDLKRWNFQNHIAEKEKIFVSWTICEILK